ncbi:MAG: nucleotidyltransferase family protein [Gemmatimonadota bacterium]
MSAAPPLSGPISTMLPDPESTLLVRSALWLPEAAREAILEWQTLGSLPAKRMSDQGRLLAPLISANLGQAPVGLDGRLVTYLRTALVREELRGAEYRRILAGLLDVFSRSGPPLLLFEGAALAEMAYPRPELRHTHGISTLIYDDDGERAAAILPEAGFHVTAGRDDLRGVRLRALHDSGLALTLRFGSLPFPHYGRFPEDLWRRAEERQILGSPTRVLSPADSLWHTCARAATGQRRATLLWACDAFFVREVEPALDWDVFIGQAARTDTTLPTHALLTWLAEAIGVPVPAAVLDRLARDAERAGRTARQIALAGAAWRAGPKLVPFLRASRSWSDRFTIARWRFFPSAATLQGAGQIRTRVAAPVFLATRPARLVLGKVRGRWRRHRPPPEFSPPTAPAATSGEPP